MSLKLTSTCLFSNCTRKFYVPLKITEKTCWRENLIGEPLLETGPISDRACWRGHFFKGEKEGLSERGCQRDL